MCLKHTPFGICMWPFRIPWGGLIVIFTISKYLIGVKNSKKLLEDLPNKIRDVLGIVPKVKLTKKGNKEIISVEIEQSFAPTQREI